jgi:hypothetical protein
VTRYTYILGHPKDRERAIATIQAAPVGTRVVVKAPRRTLGQNDRMWWMLTHIANQLPWHGRKLRPDDWKILFLDALKREVEAVPNIDGTGFVGIGRSSSDLSKSEMSDLMELISAFAALHDVTFPDYNQGETK